MNVLLVYAHPEPTSLNGTLKAFTVERLQRAIRFHVLEVVRDQEFAVHQEDVCLDIQEALRQRIE